ncbi:MAG: PilZ domain-containing protein [Gammaproteobacteria bacterium]|nr:PilZ domain-containing protein [Gammaproteobacteria bacterium]
MTTNEEMRQYIRHPTNIPIEYSILDVTIEDKPHVRNISRSGLCFTTSTRIEPDKIIHIKILLEGYDFEVEGIVMWCRDSEDHPNERYEVGVKFCTPRAELSVRMIEKLCHIEEYRQQVATREGRMLTSHQAALEWLEKFSDNFP